jgi:hypothetical protein
MEKSCATCKWLKMEPTAWTKHDPPRLKPGAGGRCEWPVPSMVLADSITKACNYRPVGTSRNYMQARHHGCPVWEAR